MRVSTIIAVHNGADHFERAIESARAQSHAPCEIVVVDDGSTDATPELIRSYGSNLRAFRQDKAGLGAAHNFALTQATGDAIAFLDHDDLWPPHRLSAMVQVMQPDERIDIVAGKFEVKIEGGNANAASHHQRYATAHRPWSVQSLLIRPRVFDRVGYFNVNCSHGMDIDWYLRAREAGVQYELIPETTLVFRMHATNMTRDVEATFGGIVDAFKSSLDRRRKSV